MDTLIGRNEELGQLELLFSEGRARLVTLTGPPGVGKTRLALAWSERPSVFVDLRSASDLDGLVASVARTLDIPVAGGIYTRLDHVLSARGSITLILDNFEQVAGHAHATINRWLEAAPALSVLVTSRERLGLEREHVLAVGPLKLPVGDDLAGSDAAELLLALVARARREPGHKLNASTVAAILRKLDGLPLALELAAPRIALLGPEALLERLEQPFAVLGGREDTLRRAIASSWELLDEPTREAFAQCSVFPTSFDLVAAEQILSLSRGATALDALQSLYDRSLIRTPVPGRFDMLVSLKAFATERLIDPAPVRARYDSYYLTLAAEAEGALVGEGSERTWAQLRSERAHITLAIERSTDLEHAAKAACVLAELYVVDGSTAAEEAQLSRLIDSDLTSRDALLEARGQVRYQDRRFSEAEADFEAAAALASRRDRPRIELRALRGLSQINYMRGNQEQALHLLSTVVVPLAQATDERLEEARALAAQGLIHVQQGDSRDAEECLTAALAILRPLGAIRHEWSALVYLSFLYANTRRGKQALEAIERAEALLERVGARRFGFHTAWYRAAALLESGAYAAARRSFEMADEINRHYGSPAAGASLGGYSALAHVLGTGAWRSVEAEFLAAGTRCEEAGIVVEAAFFFACASAAAAHRGSEADARQRLERARELAAHAEDAIIVLEVDLLGETTDPERFRAALRAAKSQRASTVAPYDRSLELRLAYALSSVGRNERVLPWDAEAWLRYDESSGTVWTSSSADPIELGDRDALRLVLMALVRAAESASRLGQHEVWVTTDALAHAAWPGEALEDSTSQNRVRVAIATLRKLGLRDMIESGKGSYRIRRSVVVEPRIDGRTTSR